MNKFVKYEADGKESCFNITFTGDVRVYINHFRIHDESFKVTEHPTLQFWQVVKFITPPQKGFVIEIAQ